MKVVLEKLNNERCVQILKENSIEGRKLICLLLSTEYERVLFTIKGYAYSKWRLLNILNQNRLISTLHQNFEQLQTINFTIYDENPVTIVIEIL